ncbi:MAG TPA: 3-isopropylmalate dehydratase small subunit [bacterium]|nr:3-isopropylmalate dehydratase small subunit [bacterium]
MIIIPEKIINNISGKVVIKLEDDQNTDDIIPARYLKEITFKNMGEYVYYDERFKNGELVKDHPFNKYKGANILVAGANYGCGSSREHAPQALHRWGIKAIIAESFAEIFAGNCASLGVVGITVSHPDILKLANALKEDILLNIDIDKKTIKYNGNVIEFEIPEGRRQAFLNGIWDAMAILQQNKEGIKKVLEKLDYLRFNGK